MLCPLKAEMPLMRRDTPDCPSSYRLMVRKGIRRECEVASRVSPLEVCRKHEIACAGRSGNRPSLVSVSLLAGSDSHTSAWLQAGSSHKEPSSHLFKLNASRLTLPFLTGREANGRLQLLRHNVMATADPQACPEVLNLTPGPEPYLHFLFSLKCSHQSPHI